jgi:hypothetical protein
MAALEGIRQQQRQWIDRQGLRMSITVDATFGAISEPFAVARSLPGDSADRKRVPMASGLLDYFPDALAEIAHVSYLGNEKHNPGEPLHWSRGKSMDHADCIIRHLTERGSRDPAGIRHSAQMAWRALALLQQELEDDLGLGLPRGAKNSEAS